MFFILYGITGVVPLIAALYLLLRKGNAFAPGVTPPLRLRRWAAAFFAKAFSGRTARKVYWALVVDVPSIEDGSTRFRSCSL